MGLLNSFRTYARNVNRENGPPTVDYAQLEELSQLRVLSVFGPRWQNVTQIGKLRELRHLSLLECEENGVGVDTSIFTGLPNLQYLAAGFSGNVDFSFVERMSRLQTLCILGLDTQHDLQPVIRSPRLTCLALHGKPDLREAEQKMILQKVDAFRLARPDIQVVVYEPFHICLGSFWLLPLAGAAAVLAWRIRQRRKHLILSGHNFQIG